jgi:cytochrome c peroxidase
MFAKKTTTVAVVSIALFAFTRVASYQPKSIFKQPSNFPKPVYHFKTNPVTQAGFALGRDLFYDATLSRNYTVSCSFCHIQSAAFTHHGHDISHGIDNLVTSRNAPPIMNLAWNTSFMWDGRVTDLDQQPFIPITDHVEMDCRLDTIVARLQHDGDYPSMFKKAFGSSTITADNVLKALSQFMLMCVSANSKYDKVMRHEEETFTADEQVGYEIFKKDCNSCHREPLFTDYSFRNNGFNVASTKDKGRFDVTHDSSDLYKFKVPSLRNLAYTAPYMHNGQLYQFRSIIPQYRFSVKDNPDLDGLLKHDGKTGFEMTDEEAKQLAAFLQTLNDRSFVNNPALSEPELKHPSTIF